MTTASIQKFRDALKGKTRDELLEIIKDQNIDYIKQIRRIEFVFKAKLGHLTWGNGIAVTQRKLTNEELILLIDPPFIFDKELAKLGFTEAQQRVLHVGSDPVLWAKEFLTDVPRVYQTLILRDPSPRRVMRFGRRLGKTTTLAFLCLWYAYTHKEGKILVVAPMKTHVGLIYDEIMRMAKQNPLILPKDDAKTGAIIRYVQSPQYQINFENEAMIKFFTTGMKSNSKADVARGQEADVIILDEMDYMGKDDLIALLAMLQTTNEKKQIEKQLIGASTPTGQRNTFYDWCTNPEQEFSAYWFPSYCNPGWGNKIERRMRLDYPNEQAYRHEIEADWGEDTEGVYPHRYIEVAFKDPGWDYIDGPTSPNSDFVMGIDWDKYLAGVNIVVLEICHSNYEIEEYQNKVRLVYRTETMKSDFHYLDALDQIYELNRRFNPKWIYADRGAGEVQVELLHKHGKEHPETGLQKKVKGWQFSETIDMRDPWTQQIVKKRLKPFMVDNLYQMLEQERIIFSGKDEQLSLALMAYIVERVSATTGAPVFKAGGNTTDHAHDALILACFAIADNYDDLLNPVYATRGMSISSDSFLPTFALTNEEDRELAEDTWGKGKGPVMINRPMARSVRRGNRGGTSSMTRKMF